MNLKFRIWDKARNCFLEQSDSSLHAFTDYYITLDGKVAAYEGAISNPQYVEKASLDYLKIEKGPKLNNISAEDRFVIQRWIGVTDNKGKDWYEGDVIELPITEGIKQMMEDETFWERGIITYHPELAGFCLDFYSPQGGEGYTGRDDWVGPYMKCDAKIIGNIFENPELLA